ncbi:hypothetical protein J2X36_002404 [Methylobacterium sp. BE186]|uniref:hypothetical protein n=1 Tax=Methylobacterium sp. BE186 TaxID=2817715 RepID=UPI002862BD31|nr:hypothetical protein [Methylobacterium sp. BE186]MDR7037653.1 hypothetical protein [Methylobacterium sp. BE186]
MPRPVTYRIVDDSDGLFAVAALSSSGALYRRGGFRTLAEAERCIEDLRAAMVACGAPLVRWEGGVAACRPPSR